MVAPPPQAHRATWWSCQLSSAGMLTNPCWLGEGPPGPSARERSGSQGRGSSPHCRASRGSPWPCSRLHCLLHSLTPLANPGHTNLLLTRRVVAPCPGCCSWSQQHSASWRRKPVVANRLHLSVVAPVASIHSQGLLGSLKQSYLGLLQDWAPRSFPFRTFRSFPFY